MTGTPRLVLGAALLLGIASGLGAFVFVYARGHSYLTNNPAACANCHIMRDYYSTWLASSHQAAATCNECHTPPGLLATYATKARNGFWHSFYFTLGGYPDPVRIRPRNRAVTEQACRHCHQAITEAIDATHAGTPATGQITCSRCHFRVGHWVRQ